MSYTIDRDASLEARDLRVSLGPAARPLFPVDGVSLSLRPRDAIGIVGESGCGKSMLALALMGLLPRGVRWHSGTLHLGSMALTQASAAQWRRLRGATVAMVFQDSLDALNPVLTVGDQIEEVLALHTHLGKKERQLRCLELLEQVGIDRPELRRKQIPSLLSGGMRQRVLIAMALAGKPRFLFADEPTTALDVTVQNQVMDLLSERTAQLDMGLLLITHDLPLLRARVSQVVVMYRGVFVEKSSVEALFDQPLHPYTQGLLTSLPQRREGSTVGKKPLATLPGNVPRLDEALPGCRFEPRCPHAMPQCRQSEPPLRPVSSERQVACWLHVEGPT